jgi:hypothetical protein
MRRWREGGGESTQVIGGAKEVLSEGVLEPSVLRGREGGRSCLSIYRSEQWYYLSSDVMWKEQGKKKANHNGRKTLQHKPVP